MIHISTSFALLVVAIIILVCIAGSRLSGRLGVPTLFIFIMLGMLFGSDGIFKIPFGNFALAEQVCSVALIFIMFYGGFGTRWSEAKPVDFVILGGCSADGAFDRAVLSSGA